MLIVILGNIASGKSTLAHKINKATGYQLLSIDTYRKRHNKSQTEIGDRLAWEHMIKHIQKGKDAILEMTGTGKHYERCMMHYPGTKMIVMVDADADKCKANHKRRLKRGYKLPPMWYDVDINESIDAVARLLPTVDYDILYTRDMEVDFLISIMGL